MLIMADGSGDETVWRGCPDRQSQSSPVMYCWVAGSIANVAQGFHPYQRQCCFGREVRLLEFISSLCVNCV